MSPPSNIIVHQHRADDASSLHNDSMQLSMDSMQLSSFVEKSICSVAQASSMDEPELMEVDFLRVRQDPTGFKEFYVKKQPFRSMSHNVTSRLGEHETAAHTLRSQRAQGAQKLLSAENQVIVSPPTPSSLLRPVPRKRIERPPAVDVNALLAEPGRVATPTPTPTFMPRDLHQLLPLRRKPCSLSGKRRGSGGHLLLAVNGAEHVGQMLTALDHLNSAYHVRCRLASGSR